MKLKDLKTNKIFHLFSIDRTGNFPLMEIISNDGEIRQELYKDIKDKYFILNIEFKSQ